MAGIIDNRETTHFLKATMFESVAVPLTLPFFVVEIRTNKPCQLQRA